MVKMSRVEMMRALVEQRLTAAAEEIFGLFERTIAEYEEELRCSKEENERQQKLLDAFWKRGFRLQGADIQQLLDAKEERSPSPDQEDPPESPHDNTEQIEIGTDGEDCERPQPASNSLPDTQLQPENGEQPEESTVNEDVPEITESHLGLTFQKNNEVSHSAVICNNDETPFSSSLCGEQLKQKNIFRQERKFCCTVCSKTFTQKQHLTRHMLVHTGERNFSCPICSKTFTRNTTLTEHIAVHTGEKRFSCPICSKQFKLKGNLTQHMLVHTGERNFSCSLCSKTFTKKENLTRHMVVHTGERNFICAVCGKTFNRNTHLRSHMAVHTGGQVSSLPGCDQMTN